MIKFGPIEKNTYSMSEFIYKGIGFGFPLKYEFARLYA